MNMEDVKALTEGESLSTPLALSVADTVYAKGSLYLATARKIRLMTQKRLSTRLNVPLLMWLFRLSLIIVTVFA